MAEARAAGFEEWADDQRELLDHERTLPTHFDPEKDEDSLAADQKIGHEMAGVVQEAKLD